MSENIARHLALMAEAHPDRAAIKIPCGRRADGGIDYLTLSFRELVAEANAWATKLGAKGVGHGDRTLVMVRPGLPLIASVFGLFQMGAVPIVIDPGMGLKNFLACVQRSQPKALVGIPIARLLSHLHRSAFRSVSIRVPASGSPTARLVGVESCSTRNPDGRSKTPPLQDLCYPALATDLAAILFTSGSTGSPKGVRYEHGMLQAQVDAVRTTYAIEAGEIDFPLLPIFALFNPALGMTTIVPELDPKRPATIDPAAAVRAIQQENVTSSFGSPTLWKIIGDYCIANRIELPSLKRVLCAGAPVPASLWSSAPKWLTRGTLQSPYGATEALPISNVTQQEIDPDSTAGACVGKPVNGVEIRIIDPDPTGVGEIAVRGPMVTKEYDNLPEATAAAKVFDPKWRDGLPPVLKLGQAGARPSTGSVWHRMGDCGRVDAKGKLWFLGRTAEAVVTSSGCLYTEPCEQVFRRNPHVRRCALIGLGERPNQTPAIVIEADQGIAQDKLAAELAELGKKFSHTSGISSFFFHPSFPVDVRHNAKIHRLALARWAATTPATLPRS